MSPKKILSYFSSISDGNTSISKRGNEEIFFLRSIFRFEYRRNVSFRIFDSRKGFLDAFFFEISKRLPSFRLVFSSSMPAYDERDDNERI